MPESVVGSRYSQSLTVASMGHTPLRNVRFDVTDVDANHVCAQAALLSQQQLVVALHGLAIFHVVLSHTGLGWRALYDCHCAVFPHTLATCMLIDHSLIQASLYEMHCNYWYLSVCLHALYGAAGNCAG